jgi:hypothetical protein
MQESMLPAGFEPEVPASERSHTYALENAATGIGFFVLQCVANLHKNIS